MKKLLVLMLAMCSFAAIAQVNSGIVELEVDSIGYDAEEGIGVISIDVELAQNINDLDERTLRDLKIDILKRYFNMGSGWTANVAFLGYQIKNDVISVDDTFKLEQIRLINGQIKKITAIGASVKLVVEAHVGLGFHTGNMADGENMILSDQELAELQAARNCPNCTAEGVMQAGSLPYTYGMSVRVNYKNSYLKLYGDFQRSGMYRRLLDEDYAEGGYRMVFDWERRNILTLGAEAGFNFKAGNVPMSAFGRVQYNKYSSFSSFAEQGSMDFYDSFSGITRPVQKTMLFEAGIRVRLFNR